MRQKIQIKIRRGKMTEENNSLEKKYEYAWDKYTKENLVEVFALSDRYKEFMSKCKTERECVTEFIARAEKNGYKDIKDIIKGKISVKPGDKVYANNKGKAVVM